MEKSWAIESTFLDGTKEIGPERYTRAEAQEAVHEAEVALGDEAPQYRIVEVDA